jgi:hypothetical protein
MLQKASRFECVNLVIEDTKNTLFPKGRDQIGNELNQLGDGGV